MNERKGYIKEENNKWFCRVTFTDSTTGKTHNKKRICKTESEAKVTLKKLLKQIDNEGEKGLWSERAAILEYESNLSRDESEFLTRVNLDSKINLSQSENSIANSDYKRVA